MERRMHHMALSKVSPLFGEGHYVFALGSFEAL